MNWTIKGLSRAFGSPWLGPQGSCSWYVVLPWVKWYPTNKTPTKAFLLSQNLFSLPVYHHKNNNTNYEMLKMGQPTLPLEFNSLTLFLTRDLFMYLVDMADLSPGQLWAAEDVPGEGTLAAPLTRDDREGRKNMAAAMACSSNTCWLLTWIMPFKLSSVLVCPRNRRSWTTPVTAFLRYHTTDTPQHLHDDDVSPKASWTHWNRERWQGIGCCQQIKVARTFFYNPAKCTVTIYSECREWTQISRLGSRLSATYWQQDGGVCASD